MKRSISTIFTHLPATLKKPKKHFNFGTAGYRDDANDLANTLCRASLLAMIRSSTFCGKMIGLMITASHNKNTDNGLKIIDHSGDYIEKNLEEYCDEIVNCNDKDLYKILSKIHRKLGNMRDLGNGPTAHIAIGRDTRESGQSLEDSIKSILELLGCKVISYGIVTTPQMHYLIRKNNQQGKVCDKEEYYDNLKNAYYDLQKLSGQKENAIQIDTAHGVGALAINELAKRIKTKEFVIINKGETKNENFEPETEFLNKKCGADYILSNNAMPQHINENLIKNPKCAALDGDADRLIYFTSNANNLRVLNGDRMAVFLGNYFYTLVSDQKNISVGVVMSHYSNSASINVLNDKICVVTANTGVKNFIKKSRQYDIGIFFEPNGHGSVTFSEKLMTRVNETLNTDNENQFTKPAKIIKALSNIFDPCVGDAIGNLLAFELLTDDGMFDKIMTMYENLPTRMLNVKVRDKNILLMKGDIEIVEPKNLNLAISTIVKDFGGRVFVRPSGTEDLVRVFAESNTQNDCDKLVLLVAEAVYKYCDGVGYYPEIQYEKIEKVEL